MSDGRRTYQGGEGAAQTVAVDGIVGPITWQALISGMLAG
jgi:hypothetical protein